MFSLDSKSIVTASHDVHDGGTVSERQENSRGKYPAAFSRNSKVAAIWSQGIATSTA